MAYRIHVTAVRNSTAEAIRSTYCDILGSGFADVALAENTGWISFRTSVWNVSSRDLIKGLQQLNKPGLQFTTEDASRWYVTMCMPETEPETMVHEFGHHEQLEVDEEYYAADDEDDYVDPELAFLEDEPPQPAQAKTALDRFAEDFAELGAPLPQSLVGEIRSLAFAEAVAQYRLWHQDRLIGFLRAAGVCCDDNAVRKVLAWQGITEVERDSDIGNLPRLLSQIGLGEEWEQYVAEAENPHPEPEYEDEEGKDQDAPDPKRFIDDAECAMGSVEALPVDGGPVDLLMQHFHRVQFFPEACQVENEIRALLTAELPEMFDREALDRLTAGARMDRAGCA